MAAKKKAKKATKKKAAPKKKNRISILLFLPRAINTPAADIKANTKINLK